jgi:hypothetical protein
MALVIADRVRETTTTSGASDIYLGGAVTGFVPFSSVLSNGSTTFYAIIANAGGQWEVGIGTYTTATNSLVRTTVLSSSNSNTLVDFTSGTKNVVMTQPSERTVYVDGANVAAANGATVPNGLLANSSVTFNGQTVSLGASGTITATAPFALTLGTGLTGTSYNGSAAVTAAIDDTVVVTLTGTQTLTNKTLDGGTLVTANSAADALKITQTGAGNALVVEDATSPDPSPFVITANGSVVAGYTSTVNAGGANNPKLEVLGTTDSLSTIAAGRWSADTSPSSLYAIKSRNAVVGSSTIVQSGDQVGQVVFAADDGVTFIPAGSIVAEVDGTPGASDMPGRLVFKTTADGAATSTTAMTINNAQQVGIGPAPVTSKGTLQVGTIGYTDTGVVGGFASSVAGYNQIILQNTSANSAASTNFNISNDAGTSTTNFGEIGINSSTFSGTGSFGGAGYVYLASASTDLVIGTYGSNNIRFVINTGAADAAIINTSGNFGIGVAPTAALTLKAGTATASTAPLKFTAGTNLTTPEAGVFEFDGNAFYSTDDVTGGRGYIPSVHYFRLTADGSAIGAAIANYFPGTSGVAMDNNIFYELEANLFFTKTTAGTVTFTMTFTNAPVNNEAWYTGSPVGGIGTVGAPQTAAIVKSTATAGALPATGSLTTAVNHQYQLSSMFQTNATTGGTLNIQITSSAGTVTPLTGSYFKITRLPSANSGAFV